MWTFSKLQDSERGGKPATLITLKLFLLYANTGLDFREKVENISSSTASLYSWSRRHYTKLFLPPITKSIFVNTTVEHALSLRGVSPITHHHPPDPKLMYSSRCRHCLYQRHHDQTHGNHPAENIAPLLTALELGGRVHRKQVNTPCTAASCPAAALTQAAWSHCVQERHWRRGWPLSSGMPH